MHPDMRYQAEMILDARNPSFVSVTSYPVVAQLALVSGANQFDQTLAKFLSGDNAVARKRAYFVIECVRPATVA
jgi:hypothetical protein